MEKELEIYLNYLKNVFELESDISDILEVVPSVIKSIKKSSKTSINNGTFNKLLSASLGRTVNIEDYTDIDINKVLEKNTKKVLFGLLRIDYKKVKEQIIDSIVKEGNRRIQELNKMFKESGLKIPQYIKDTVSDIEMEYDKALFNEFVSKAEQCIKISDLIAVCDAIKQKIYMARIAKKIEEMSESLNDIEYRLSNVESKVDNL